MYGLCDQVFIYTQLHNVYIHEQYTYMHMPQGLNVADLEDLLEDIEIYRRIEKDTNWEFWKVRSMCIHKK